MADLIQLNDPRVDQELQRYLAELDALAFAALEREMPESEFRQELERSALAALFVFFLLGGGDFSVPGATGMVDQRRSVIRQSVAKLANDIYSGKYSRQVAEGAVKRTAEEGRDMLRNRLTLWANDGASHFESGKVHSPPRLNAETGTIEEPRYQWRRGPTSDSCSDCIALDGVILTASEWRRTGIQPKSFDLECRGFNCLCELVQVQEPSVGFENLEVFI